MMLQRHCYRALNVVVPSKGVMVFGEIKNARQRFGFVLTCIQGHSNTINKYV